MKVTIYMKSPDCVYDALYKAVYETRPEGLTEDEWRGLREERLDEFREKCSKFIEYGEYITVEIDMDAGTARVVPVR